VGGQLRADVAGAGTSGMRVILLRRREQQEGELEDREEAGVTPDARISSLRELGPLLEAWGTEPVASSL